MSNEAFFYWGMVVTTFLVLAALLTFRELVERGLEQRLKERDDSGRQRD